MAKGLGVRTTAGIRAIADMVPTVGSPRIAVADRAVKETRVAHAAAVVKAASGRVPVVAAVPTLAHLAPSSPICRTISMPRISSPECAGIY